MKTPSPKKHPHVLAAIYGQPWAITESWLDTIAGIVEERSKANIDEFKAAVKDASGKKEDSNLEIQDGVAIIPVMGPIFPRANLMTMLSGATSSADVSNLIGEALDQKVQGIVFQIDSPGGSVSGGFEVANQIASLPVPSVAMIEGAGSSLAYLWASQCDQVCVSQASVVGSVSVVMRMASDDRAMRNEGRDIVTMKSGNLKQSGDPASLAFANQYQSLLGQLDTYHQMFVSMVGTARPKMDMAKVATGDVWIGQKAVAAGLADKVCTLADVLADFRD